MKIYILTFLGVVALNANAASITFSCIFPDYVDQTERNASSDFGFELYYDTISKEAFIKGALGLSVLQVITGSEGISFIETLATGATQTTTLDLSSIATGSVAAVHSRHTFLFGLFPSQSYGTCKTHTE